MRRILSLFRHKPPVARSVDPKALVILPVTVMDAIDAAHVTARFGKEYDEPRVIVTLPGIKPWRYSDDGDGCRKVFASIFPELSEKQLSKAVQRLEFRIAAAAVNSIAHSQQAPRSARIGGVSRDDDFRVRL